MNFHLSSTMAIDIHGHNLTSETHNTYDVLFFNDSIFTTITNDPHKVSDWISDIQFVHRRRLHSLIVGLDVEWHPSFTRHVQNIVSTLQLCVGRRCLIYQILHSHSIPQSLADFLSDKDYTFVGVGVKADLEKLDNDYDIGDDANYVDLRMLAADQYNDKKLKNAGLKELARVVLGKEVDKPHHVTVSRWDNRRLTADQVQYACVDAFLSFEIGRILGASDY